MRGFAHCAAVGMLLAAGLTPAAQAQTKDAASVIAAARQALGGEKKIAAVKSFTATGRTRQVRGENLVPIEFEIFVELPDKYVRRDEIPAQESGPTASGFTGDELLQDPLPPAPMPDPARKARVGTLKQDFARLVLGMFAGSYPAYPLTFTYVGQAEAPQGKADVIDAKGPDNVTLRYFINSETHLPIMVTWQPPAGRGAGPGGPGGPGRGGAPGAPGGAPGAPGQRGAGPGAAAPAGAAPAGAPPRQGGPPAAGAPPAGATPPAGTTPPAGPPAGGARPPGGTPPAGGPPAGAPPAGAPPAGAPPAGAPPAGAPPGGAGPGGAGPGGAPPAGGPAGPRPEFRLYFADYRDVDGLQLPFRLRRATGTDTTEETTFDRFKLNAKIDPKKFEVKK